MATAGPCAPPHRPSPAAALRPLPVRRFLHGKTVLLTGATGFLGKVVAERLLRCAPEIARIYLLIRTRRDPKAPGVPADRRFETEVLPSGAFETLAGLRGDGWSGFARDRLVPIAGDVSQPGLGLDDRDLADLASRVDIIVNAAASVVFDEPLDEALRHNVRSAAHVAAFARRCRAASLVHVSTAFVAGRRVERFTEAPLTHVSSGEVDAAEAVVDAILQTAAAEGWNDRRLRARLVDEGMARAARHGWHDIYTYTKALGELVLADYRGDVPTAIIRPTIIESSLRDPYPGWLENLNVGDPLWVEFGRGRMPDFPLAPGAILDMVPVDFVANALLAVLPRLGDTADIGYYTVGSGALNPLTGARIHEVTYDYFLRHPMYDRQGQPITPRRLTFPSYERFREMFGAAADRSTTTKRLLYLADLYAAYVNTSCVFDTTNTQRLLDELDDADRDTLDFDVRRIDWHTYIQEVHIPGLRRHVLGEDPARRPAVRHDA